jgi:hypothetical protein
MGLESARESLGFHVVVTLFTASVDTTKKEVQSLRPWAGPSNMKAADEGSFKNGF